MLIGWSVGACHQDGLAEATREEGDEGRRGGGGGTEVLPAVGRRGPGELFLYQNICKMFYSFYLTVAITAALLCFKNICVYSYIA